MNLLIEAHFYFNYLNFSDLFSNDNALVRKTVKQMQKYSISRQNLKSSPSRELRSRQPDLRVFTKAEVLFPTLIPRFDKHFHVWPDLVLFLLLTPWPHLQINCPKCDRLVQHRS